MGSELVVATAWHDPDRRKLEAVKAAHGDTYNPERLHDLLQAFTTYKGRKGARTSQRTRDTYKTGLQDFLRWVRNQHGAHLLRLTEDDIELYLAHLTERGVMPGTASTYLSAVRAFYRALLWARAVDVSPCEGVRSPVDPREKHERRDPVPLDGFKAMLELASVRDRAILHVMGSCGLRISECVGLDVDDLQGGVLRVKRGKGGKSRKVPMTPATKDALNRWLREREAAAGESAVFVNYIGNGTKAERAGRRMSTDTARAAIKRLIKAAGLDDKLSPHSLRHLTGTRLYQKTRDLFMTSRVLGHSDVSTSSIYSKMQLEDVREVMDDLD